MISYIYLQIKITGTIQFIKRKIFRVKRFLKELFIKRDAIIWSKFLAMRVTRQHLARAYFLTQRTVFLKFLTVVFHSNIFHLDQMHYYACSLDQYTHQMHLLCVLTKPIYTSRKKGKKGKTA